MFFVWRVILGFVGRLYGLDWSVLARDVPRRCTLGACHFFRYRVLAWMSEAVVQMIFTADGVAMKRRTNYILATEEDDVVVLRWIRPDLRCYNRLVYRGVKVTRDRLWAEPNAAEDHYTQLGKRVRWEL